MGELIQLFNPIDRQRIAEKQFKLSLARLRATGVENVLRRIAFLNPELKAKKREVFLEEEGQFLNPAYFLLGPDRLMQGTGEVARERFEVNASIVTGTFTVGIFESGLRSDANGNRVRFERKKWGESGIQSTNSLMAKVMEAMTYHGFVPPDKLDMLGEAFMFPANTVEQ